ncbi:imidazoleglycerol-phosphate dehydratase HisB [Thermodesulfobacteriota bacterium]
MEERKAKVKRKTKETDIELMLNLDGSGQASADTGIPFMDHMISLMAAHGFMDIQITARGDTEIDDHHTVEDLGICFGKAFRQALGDKTGIKRYGQAIIPMDEALAMVAVDISNRPFIAYRVDFGSPKTGNFDAGLIGEFFRALVNGAGMTLHVKLFAGTNTHHIIESIFKAFGRAVDQAVTLENRLGSSVPSTKGVL